jgi:hypothetical protein
MTLGECVYPRPVLAFTQIAGNRGAKLAWREKIFSEIGWGLWEQQKTV